jgi:FMN phosphatase YigB (HAD superfamily)
MPQKIMLVDLEGTLTDNRHRADWLPSSELTGKTATKAWNDYYKMLAYDPAYPAVIDLCQTSLAKHQLELVIVSGVTQRFEQLIKYWLQAYELVPALILLRPNDNKLANVDLKTQFVEQLYKLKYELIMGIDDMPEILAMYKIQKIPLRFLAKYGKLYPHK